jgi:kumamolisin
MGGARSRAAATLGMICLIGALLGSRPSSASAVHPQGAGAVLATGAGAALSSAGRAILASSDDLGPSAASDVRVIVALRHAEFPQQLTTWAATRHLRVTWTAPESWAVLSGPAPVLAKALATPIDDFRATDGQKFYAALATPKVHASLGGEVQGLGSITSYAHLKEMDVPSGGLTPTGLVQAYDATPLTFQGYLGQGMTVVLFETDGFSQSDFTRFTTKYHLPPIRMTVIGGQAGKPSGETELDAEAVHEIAPDANLVYFNFLTNSSSTMVSDFSKVTKLYPGSIWNFSLGACEYGLLADKVDFTKLEDALQAAEGTGSTIFAASGDAGGFDCTPPLDWGDNPQQSYAGVTFPADMPAVTGVGGTSLSVDANGDYAGEAAWTESLLSQGTGGGVSVVWNDPGWEKAPGTGDYDGAQPGLQVPDVAAVADPSTGVAGVNEGSAIEGGGTSLAAPVWAGFTALIDEYLERQHLGELGFANQDFFEIASRVEPYPAFHDVVSGGGALYPATPGYDMATGLGSPDVWNLVRDLASLLGTP